MAPNATESNKQLDSIPLKILVDKKKNKVIFAEAGKDFADVLLSFLTLPLGTIVRLVAMESNACALKVGSLSSLYESVSSLDEKHFWTHTCKEMLLQPRNSMEDYRQQLKLNIDNTEPTNYYFCKYCIDRLNLFSSFKNQRCRCGKLMDHLVVSKNKLFNLPNGFVKETSTFIVSDDLYIMPNVFGASVSLFQKLGIEDMEAVEEQSVDISKNKVVDLLKFSLISSTPMTDLILRKEQYIDKFTPTNRCQFEIEEVTSDESRHIVVKIQLRKSNGKVMFAEAEEGFADFIFSFLTFPLGGVVQMLEGFSSLNCIDELYKSMTDLSADRYLCSKELEEKLAKPVCAAQFNLSNQILPIGTQCLFRSHRQLIDPKSPTGESTSPGGFVKGPMYMVTDDLVVTPSSARSAVSYLKALNVPLFDLEERVIKIGVKEGLGILKASLTSTSALTNGLAHLIKPTKKENAMHDFRVV